MKQVTTVVLRSYTLDAVVPSRSSRSTLSRLARLLLQVGALLGASAPVAKADERGFSPADSPALGAEESGIEGPGLTLAETLYREGRRLLSEKNYAAAAAKLAESYRLDPGIGTLLSLAICHEAQGKFATAWLEFGDAMRAAQRENRDDRVQLARKHLAEIERRLSRLTISVDVRGRPNGLVVKLDGIQIRAAAEGVPVPIDPGPHTIEATAPGKHPWREHVVIGAESDQRLVVIRNLVDLAPEQRPAGDVMPVHQAADDRSWVTRTTESLVPMYISGGVTLVLIGGAVGTGVAYHDAKVSYESLRADEGASPGALDERRSAALRLGWLNVGLTVGAVVGAGLTTYFYLARSAPTAQKASSGLRVVPWGTPSGAGVGVSSVF